MERKNYYQIRFLLHSDLPHIFTCLSSVVSFLEDKEIFVAPSQEYINTIISGYGRTAGILLDNDLIGFASIIYPKKGKNNIGHLMALDAKGLLDVVQLEHICISPAFRRKGLGRKLAEFLITNLDSTHTTLLSTVSPRNLQSLSIAFSIHQRVVSHTKIYGVNRFIMYRNLSSDLSEIPESTHEIPAINIDEIIEALRKGYVGISFGKTKSTIIFAKGEVCNEKIPN